MPRLRLQRVLDMALNEHPVGSLDHLYHELQVAARRFEDVSDELHWGPFLAPSLHAPPEDDTREWESWEQRYRAAEERLEEAEIALLKAIGRL